MRGNLLQAQNGHSIPQEQETQKTEIGE